MSVDSVFSESMVFPAFAPLRLWTKRESGAKKEVIKPTYVHANGGTRAFSIKGGFANSGSDQRRLIIVGKIFRN
ncbi:MAG: hypothetical protein Q4F84_00225 [Fibrobacter sp.]|nr:hypothetical protein [Fibrobacter sp.]